MEELNKMLYSWGRVVSPATAAYVDAGCVQLNRVEIGLRRGFASINNQALAKVLLLHSMKPAKIASSRVFSALSWPGLTPESAAALNPPVIRAWSLYNEYNRHSFLAFNSIP